MGMFTKLFQKSHDPYELSGRWYKMRINFNYDAAEWGKVITSDIVKADPGTPPTDLVYAITNTEDTFCDIMIGLGLVVDWSIIPVDGYVDFSEGGRMPSLKLSSNPDLVTSSVISIPYESVSDTVDVYLYIVKR